MQQYEWKRHPDGEIDYEYDDFEFNRRRSYLEQVDQYAKATARDIESSLVGGRQVFCWGAGTGKTTAIRQFIVKHFMDGVLYASFTKDEATKMAYDVASFIGHSRVLLLHTDAYRTINGEFVCMSDYINQHPELIKEFPVVITTHRRLMIDPPHLYTALLNRSKSHKSPMRKYMFIDEKPNVYDKILISREVRDLVSVVTCGSDDPDVAVECFENLLRADSPKVRSAAYNLIGYLSKTSPDRPIALDRALHVLYTIFELEANNSELVVRHDDQEVMCYYYHLGLLQVPNLVIFDGTGDCLFNGSPDWNIIKNRQFSYKFQGSIEPLDVYLPRDITSLTSDELFSWIEKLKETVENILLMNKKCLIVTWKSLHGQLSLLETNDDMPVTITTNVDPDQEFSDYVTKMLVKSGIPQESFEVTYYQSGKTRATSEFSDCDSVLFMGAFMLPNYVIHEYNKVNRTKITGSDYLLAEVVQAIYRTRARKLDPANVYLSSDFNPGFMTKLYEYLSVNTSQYFQYKLSSSIPMDPRNIFSNVLMENAEKFLTTGEITIPLSDLTKISRRYNVMRSFERFHVDGVSVSMDDSELIKLTFNGELPTNTGELDVDSLN